MIYLLIYSSLISCFGLMFFIVLIATGSSRREERATVLFINEILVIFNKFIPVTSYPFPVFISTIHVPKMSAGYDDGITVTSFTFFHTR